MAFAQTALRSPTPRVAATFAARALEPGVNPMQSIGTVANVARNRTIFSDGDDAAYSYKVVSGAVRLVKLMADGRRHVAGFQLAGDLFGIEWGPTYALTAEAVTDAVLIRYARSHLERLGEERADVRRQLAERLQSDLRDAREHLVSLGCQTARERVASFLMLLARRVDAGEGEAIDVPMGRQDIADYLGLTIETVCRTLTELKEDRLIAIPNRHQIVLADPERLEAIAEAEDDV